MGLVHLALCGGRGARVGCPRGGGDMYDGRLAEVTRVPRKAPGLALGACRVLCVPRGEHWGT